MQPVLQTRPHATSAANYAQVGAVTIKVGPRDSAHLCVVCSTGSMMSYLDCDGAHLCAVDSTGSMGPYLDCDNAHLCVVCSSGSMHMRTTPNGTQVKPSDKTTNFNPTGGMVVKCEISVELSRVHDNTLRSSSHLLPPQTTDAAHQT